MGILQAEAHLNLLQVKLDSAIGNNGARQMSPGLGEVDRSDVLGSTISTTARGGQTASTNLPARSPTTNTATPNSASAEGAGMGQILGAKPSVPVDDIHSTSSTSPLEESSAEVTPDISVVSAPAVVTDHPDPGPESRQLPTPSVSGNTPLGESSAHVSRNTPLGDSSALASATASADASGGAGQAPASDVASSKKIVDGQGTGAKTTGKRKREKKVEAAEEEDEEKVKKHLKQLTSE